MTVTTNTIGLNGLGGEPVTIQAVPAGAARSLVVDGPAGHGLPETRDRIYAAWNNSHLPMPSAGVRLRISAPNTSAVDAAADLALAAAMVAYAGLIHAAALNDLVIVGELGLDGAVRPVAGVFTRVSAAAALGAGIVVVPAANAGEALLVPGVQIIAVESLAQLVTWASTGRPPIGVAHSTPRGAVSVAKATDDLVHVPAAETVGRFAVEVAAAGGHYLSLTGLPGSAKTMLAHSLPTLLPDLDDQAAQQVTALHSIAGQRLPASDLIRRPPLQALHPGDSLATIFGGAAKPGAISLAHHGVLLLAEAPEFPRRALHALRQPLDTGHVQLARARGSVIYPAHVQLVLTASACPCPTPAPDATCCSAPSRRRYQDRSSVLLSRVDIRVTLDTTAAGNTTGETAAVVRARVSAARAAAQNRWSSHGWRSNAEVPSVHLHRGPHRLGARATEAARRRLDTGALSLDGFARVLRLAWTISDLNGADYPDADAVNTALVLHTRPMT